MIIGITGSIGAGKTTVTAMFGKLGCNVIDADKIGRTILQKDIYQDVIDCFGPRVLTKNKKIDKEKLKKIVFYNKNKLMRLNHISHPIIINKIKKQLKTNKINVIDAAVLIEANLADHLDGMIVVVAKLDQQRERVNKRDNIDMEMIERIMDSQISHKKRLKYATETIDNSGTVESTREQVAEISRKLRSAPPSKH